MSKNLCRINNMKYLPKESIWSIIPAGFGHLAALRRSAIIRASKNGATNQENRDNQSSNKKSAVFIITEQLQGNKNRKNCNRFEFQEAAKNLAASNRLLDEKSWKAKVLAKPVKNENLELQAGRLGQLKETTMPELNPFVKAQLPWIPRDNNCLTQNDGLKIKLSRKSTFMKGHENVYSDHKPQREPVQVRAEDLPEDDEKNNNNMVMIKAQKLKPKLQW